MNSQRRSSQSKAYTVVAAEFLFILLPFIVSGIVFSYKGNVSRLLYMPEWSLAASVLIGQSLVKFITGMLANKSSYAAHLERVAFGISFLIVICLVPSLIILSLILVEEIVPLGLIIAQLVVFALAVAVFFAFGAGGEALMRLKEGVED